MKTEYEFSGPFSDRSHFKLNFDGIDLEIELEDQKEAKSLIVFSFDSVVWFQFENHSTMLSFPNDSIEKVVVMSATSYTGERAHKFSPIFDENSKLYKLMLNDIGYLELVASDFVVKT